MPATEVRAESHGGNMSIKQLNGKNPTILFPLYSMCRLRIYGFNEKISIDEKTVKVANKKVIKFYDSTSYSYEKGYKYSFDLFFAARKYGKSKISFKIGDKKYTVTVIIQDLKPVKSIKIKGIYKGKNLYSLIDGNRSIMAPGANLKNAKLTIKTQKGWYVDKIYLHSKNMKGIDKSKCFKHKGTTFSFYLGKLIKSGDYGINILYVHKNGAEEEGYINIINPIFF